MKRLVCVYGIIEIPDFMDVLTYANGETASNNLYPLIAEVRNAERNGYDCSDVLLLISANPDALSDADFERIRIWLMDKIPGWNRLFEEEIHVVSAGLPGKYENNYHQERSIEDFDSASELGLFRFPINTPIEKNTFKCGVVEPNLTNPEMQKAVENWEMFA